eukprot:3118207-Rhodomonas_salina.1
MAAVTEGSLGRRARAPARALSAASKASSPISAAPSLYSPFALPASAASALSAAALALWKSGRARATAARLQQSAARSARA